MSEVTDLSSRVGGLSYLGTHSLHVTPFRVALEVSVNLDGATDRDAALWAAYSKMRNRMVGDRLRLTRAQFTDKGFIAEVETIVGG